MHLIHEIHTWQWLAHLSHQQGNTDTHTHTHAHTDTHAEGHDDQEPITLATVPAAVWDAIAATGTDTVWLMGVWQRSPWAARIARQHPDIRAACRSLLPDCRLKDIGASPYSVLGYVVDEQLGGATGLAAARAALAERGMRLLLDYVPNHVAPDHVWPQYFPHYCLPGTAAELAAHPDAFIQVHDDIFACARDPFFPPWTDSVQLNPFSAPLRAATVSTLRDIATQCDGVRCDMAMLLLDDVMQRTWGDRVGTPLPTPFWEEIIPAVRATAPDFIFLTEAYWNTEPALLEQGFTACYDKPIYDALRSTDAPAVMHRLHTTAAWQQQGRMLHFIENHDEERAAAAFASGSATVERAGMVTTSTHLQAAAVATLSLPGPRLLYEGQLDGARVHVPVQLTRTPLEAPDIDLRAWYQRLLDTIAAAQIDAPDACWDLLHPDGWPDNHTFRNLLAWSWTHASLIDHHPNLAAPRLLVVVNLSGNWAQAHIPLPDAWTSGAERIDLTDALSNEQYTRTTDELRDPGLFVDLPPWGVHLLQTSPAATDIDAVTDWSQP